MDNEFIANNLLVYIENTLLIYLVNTQLWIKLVS